MSSSSDPPKLSFKLRAPDGRVLTHEAPRNAKVEEILLRLQASRKTNTIKHLFFVDNSANPPAYVRFTHGDNFFDKFDYQNSIVECTMNPPWLVIIEHLIRITPQQDRLRGDLIHFRSALTDGVQKMDPSTGASRKELMDPCGTLQQLVAEAHGTLKNDLLGPLDDNFQLYSEIYQQSHLYPDPVAELHNRLFPSLPFPPPPSNEMVVSTTPCVTATVAIDTSSHAQKSDKVSEDTSATETATAASSKRKLPDLASALLKERKGHWSKPQNCKDIRVRYGPYAALVALAEASGGSFRSVPLSDTDLKARMPQFSEGADPEEETGRSYGHTSWANISLNLCTGTKRLFDKQETSVNGSSATFQIRKDDHANGIAILAHALLNFERAVGMFEDQCSEGLEPPVVQGSLPDNFVFYVDKGELNREKIAEIAEGQGVPTIVRHLPSGDFCWALNGHDEKTGSDARVFPFLVERKTWIDLTRTVFDEDRFETQRQKMLCSGFPHLFWLMEKSSASVWEQDKRDHLYDLLHDLWAEKGFFLMFSSSLHHSARNLAFMAKCVTQIAPLQMTLAEATRNVTANQRLQEPFFVEDCVAVTWEEFAQTVLKGSVHMEDILPPRGGLLVIKENHRYVRRCEKIMRELERDHRAKFEKAVAAAGGAFPSHDVCTSLQQELIDVMTPHREELVPSPLLDKWIIYLQVIRGIHVRVCVSEEECLKVGKKWCEARKTEFEPSKFFFTGSTRLEAEADGESSMGGSGSCESSFALEMGNGAEHLVDLENLNLDELSQPRDGKAPQQVGEVENVVATSGEWVQFESMGLLKREEEQGAPDFLLPLAPPSVDQPPIKTETFKPLQSDDVKIESKKESEEEEEECAPTQPLFAAEQEPTKAAQENESKVELHLTESTTASCSFAETFVSMSQEYPSLNETDELEDLSMYLPIASQSQHSEHSATSALSREPTTLSQPPLPPPPPTATNAFSAGDSRDNSIDVDDLLSQSTVQTTQPAVFSQPLTAGGGGGKSKDEPDIIDISWSQSESGTQPWDAQAPEQTAQTPPLTPTQPVTVAEPEQKTGNQQQPKTVIDVESESFSSPVVPPPSAARNKPAAQSPTDEEDIIDLTKEPEIPSQPLPPPPPPPPQPSTVPNAPLPPPPTAAPANYIQDLIKQQQEILAACNQTKQSPAPATPHVNIGGGGGGHLQIPPPPVTPVTTISNLMAVQQQQQAIAASPAAGPQTPAAPPPLPPPLQTPSVNRNGGADGKPAPIEINQATLDELLSFFDSLVQPRIGRNKVIEIFRNRPYENFSKLMASVAHIGATKCQQMKDLILFDGKFDSEPTAAKEKKKRGNGNGGEAGEGPSSKKQKRKESVSGGSSSAPPAVQMPVATPSASSNGSQHQGMSLDEAFDEAADEKMARELQAQFDREYANETQQMNQQQHQPPVPSLLQPPIPSIQPPTFAQMLPPPFIAPPPPLSNHQPQNIPAAGGLSTPARGWWPPSGAPSLPAPATATTTGDDGDGSEDDKGTSSSDSEGLTASQKERKRRAKAVSVRGRPLSGRGGTRELLNRERMKSAMYYNDRNLPTITQLRQRFFSRKDHILNPRSPQHQGRLIEPPQGNSKERSNATIRLRRAYGEPLFFIDRGEIDQRKRKQEYEIMGKSGDPYTVTLCKTPNCTCPDFSKGNVCKHLKFVYCLALNVDGDDPIIHQHKITDAELDQLFHLARTESVRARRLNQRGGASAVPILPQIGAPAAAAAPRGSSVAAAAQAPPVAPAPAAVILPQCPICFKDIRNERGDPVDKEQPLVLTTCCSEEIHKECLDRMLKFKQSKNRRALCPHCDDPLTPASCVASFGGSGSSQSPGGSVSSVAPARPSVPTPQTPRQKKAGKRDEPASGGRSSSSAPEKKRAKKGKSAPSSSVVQPTAATAAAISRPLPGAPVAQSPARQPSAVQAPPPPPRPAPVVHAVPPRAVPHPQQQQQPNHALAPQGQMPFAPGSAALHQHFASAAMQQQALAAHLQWMMLGGMQPQPQFHPPFNGVAHPHQQPPQLPARPPAHIQQVQPRPAPIPTPTAMPAPPPHQMRAPAPHMGVQHPQHNVARAAPAPPASVAQVPNRVHQLAQPAAPPPPHTGGSAPAFPGGGRKLGH